MRDLIKQFVADKPRNYVDMIKRKPEMLAWVLENCLVADSESIQSKIYSAVHEVSNVCQNGNIKKLRRWAIGYQGCGPASKCECTRTQTAMSVAHSKLGIDPTAANEKRQTTMIKKYGVAFNSQRSDIKHLFSKSKLSASVYNLLSDKEWVTDQYKIQKKGSQEIAKELGIYYGTVLDYIDNHGIERNTDFQRSFAEETLENEIRKVYSGSIILNDKTVLTPKHIDLYFPDKKFGIEVDGLYWHSAGTREISREIKHYHADKTNNAANVGVLLLHLTDQDIHGKMPLMMSMIKSRLGISDKIHARKCNVKEITNKEASIFLEANHISGFAVARINLALIYNGIIVSVATFNKPRFSNETDWEIVRLATLIDNNVVGGFQKMLTYFRAKYPGSILSYCDKRYGTGKVYALAGFEHTRTTDPGYCWTNGQETFTRYQTQKLKLKAFLGPKFTEGTAEESMFTAGYRKLWQCGHKVFILK